MAAPAAGDARLTVLDALRGWALLGIFIMNLQDFSGYYSVPRIREASLPATSADIAILYLSEWLLHGKFYSVFSLLFGIGFALQLKDAQRPAPERLALFRRRLAWLFVIGILHLALLWTGDILTLYASVGLLLLPFRHRTDRQLVRWAIALLLAPVALQALRVFSGGLVDPGAPFLWLSLRMDAVAGIPPGSTDLSVYGKGGWYEFLMWNLSGVPSRAGELLTEGRPLKVLAMFLVGLMVGRATVPAILSNRLLLMRVAVAGLVLGLPVNLLMALLPVQRDSAGAVLHAFLYALGVAPLALAYAAAFALAWRVPALRAAASWSAPAGRLALTNYLLQTVAGIACFYGIGLGWKGSVGPALYVPLALAVFVAQVEGSRWWLRHHAFGPMEWVWRRLTYSRIDAPPATV